MIYRINIGNMHSVIVALTGLPIGYSVLVALIGLPIGYSVIIALTCLPIGYSFGPFRGGVLSSSCPSEEAAVIYSGTAE